MKDMTRWLKALSLGVLLTLSLGTPTIHAASDAAVEMPPAEVTESGVRAPEKGCDLPAEASGTALDIENPSVAGPVSEATPATVHDESVFVCFSSDFFCGGCPSGTVCASEATPIFSGLCCTSNFQCVTYCVSGGCDGLCASVPE